MSCPQQSKYCGMTKPKLNEHVHMCGLSTVLADSTTDEDYQTTTLDATNNDWDT